MGPATVRPDGKNDPVCCVGLSEAIAAADVEPYQCDNQTFHRDGRISPVCLAVINSGSGVISYEMTVFLETGKFILNARRDESENMIDGNGICNQVK